MQLIFDCTVLIDLRTGGVLRQLSTFPWPLVICDVNLDELRQSDDFDWDAELAVVHMREQELPGDQVLELPTLATRYPRPSRHDLFALALAKHLRGTLLTGDKALRQAAEEEGIPVHGTLWILDEMVKAGDFSGVEAIRAIDTMTREERWLPKADVSRFRRSWSRANSE